MRILAASIVGVALLSPVLLRADVKTQERTQVKFEGALGRVVNIFGGRTARDGVVSIVALKGDRMLSTTGDTGQIIDLADEKVYNLDLKGKTYTVITFDEMRRQMQEAMAKAEKDAAAAKPAPEPAKPEKPSGEPQKEYDVDFTITSGTGARQIAGHDTKESVATVTVREKGKTLQEAGGLVLETHMWLAPKVPALQDLTTFRMRYAEKVYGPVMTQATPSMTQAMAMYPQMKDAMAKLAEEGKKLDGTPLFTEMVFQVAAPPESASAKAEQKQEPTPSLGGLLGGLGRMRKKNDQPAAAAGTPGRITVLTATTETLQITPSATDADVALPAGLKLKQ